MQLSLVQKKIIQNKNLGYSILKGEEYASKVMAVVHRSLYLKNHYCLYEEDKVLIVSNNEEEIERIRDLYYRADREKTTEYITLFSYQKDKVSVETLKNIVNKYFLDYQRDTRCSYGVLEDIKVLSDIITICIIEIKKLYKGLKILDTKNVQFFIDEIKWIKSCGYLHIESYQNAERTGRKVKKGNGPQRLLKNSRTREAIFKLMILYNEKLRNQNLIDSDDVVIVALEQAKKLSNKYNHIIVGDFQNLTKIQLEFLKILSSKEHCWSMMLVTGHESYQNPNAWFRKGRKLVSLELKGRVKIYSLTEKSINYDGIIDKKYIKEKCELYDMEQNRDIILSSMQEFQYCDLKHGRKYNFVRDLNAVSELTVKNEESEDEYSDNELRQLLVYNDIAAGEPILINSDIEDNFYLPKYWLKGISDCFILKVKGDSMIGANIYDGDHVVIRKQHVAQNNDIVAVNLDGSATLKRISINKKGVILMPENDKYKPMPITDEGANIIGVAVGIIKSK